mgnify:FL=1
MKREQIIERLRQLTPQLRASGATGLCLYGSRARGDSSTDSDLDVFVEYLAQQRFSLLDLVRIKHQIEDETGLTVDITTRESLHPMLREKIESEAVRVF